MYDGLVNCMEFGGLTSALCATFGVNAIFMVVKAIRARGGIHFGKIIDALREDLCATGAAAASAEWFIGENALPVVLAGLFIALFLGTIMPAVYPKMVNIDSLTPNGKQVTVTHYPKMVNK